MRQRTNRHDPGHYLACALALFITTISVWPLPCIGKTIYQQAQQLIEKGQITEARRTLQYELRVHPRNINARYDLAVLLEDIHHPAEARALYEKNLSFSSHVPSLVNLAVLLERRGKTAQAQHLLEQATKKNRHEAVFWYLLAAMSEKAGRFKHAATAFKKAIRADPLNGFAWLHFADFQSRRQLADKGVKYADKALRLLPDCAPCWRTDGDIMQAAGHNHKALAAYQRSLAIQNNSRTRRQLITVLHRLGQTARAERMQQALDARQRHERTGMGDE